MASHTESRAQHVRAVFSNMAPRKDVRQHAYQANQQAAEMYHAEYSCQLLGALRGRYSHWAPGQTKALLEFLRWNGELAFLNLHRKRGERQPRFLFDYSGAGFVPLTPSIPAPAPIDGPGRRAGANPPSMAPSVRGSIRNSAARQHHITGIFMGVQPREDLRAYERLHGQVQVEQYLLEHEETLRAAASSHYPHWPAGIVAGFLEHLKCIGGLRHLNVTGKRPPRLSFIFDGRQFVLVPSTPPAASQAPRSTALTSLTPSSTTQGTQIAPMMIAQGPPATGRLEAPPAAARDAETQPAAGDVEARVWIPRRDVADVDGPCPTGSSENRPSDRPKDEELSPLLPDPSIWGAAPSPSASSGSIPNTGRDQLEMGEFLAQWQTRRRHRP